MRKFLSRLGALIAIAGFMWTLSAVGGIDCETLTWSQFWVIVAHSVPMMLIGVRMANLYSWQ